MVPRERTEVVEEPEARIGRVMELVRRLAEAVRRPFRMEHSRWCWPAIAAAAWEPPAGLGQIQLGIVFGGHAHLREPRRSLPASSKPPGGPALDRLVDCIRLVCERFDVLAAAITAYDLRTTTAGGHSARPGGSRGLVTDLPRGPPNRAGIARGLATDLMNP